MDYRERIVCDPDIMLGQPVIKGTHVTVEFVLEKLRECASFDVILGDYPQLTSDDIFAALSYYSDKISREDYIASVLRRIGPIHDSASAR